MQKLILISLIVILFSSCERKPAPRGNIKIDNAPCICEKLSCDYCVLVISITDGDTFKGLTTDKEEIKFRIYGIDAPEKKQAFGTKSKEYLSDLIFGQTVGIKVDKKDRYGRSVVWIYTPDGKDVSAEMLKAGMAWHYKKYDGSIQYANLENEAHENKVGLWSDINPLEPWNFRK